jgi:hypothetical protein
MAGEMPAGGPDRARLGAEHAPLPSASSALEENLRTLAEVTTDGEAPAPRAGERALATSAPELERTEVLLEVVLVSGREAEVERGVDHVAERREPAVVVVAAPVMRPEAAQPRRM